MLDAGCRLVLEPSARCLSHEVARTPLGLVPLLDEMALTSHNLPGVAGRPYRRQAEQGPLLGVYRAVTLIPGALRVAACQPRAHGAVQRHPAASAWSLSLSEHQLYLVLERASVDKRCGGCRW
jgi:hypothetical protein